MYDACRHIKSGGERCKSPALHGSHFCFFHDRLHTDALSAKFDTLRVPVAEDFSSILLALSRISAALIDSRIDTKRAAQLIWIQQLAIQVVQNRRSRIENSIRQFARSAHGEEIASPLAFCDPGDDCASCTHEFVCARSPKFDESECEDDGEGYEYKNDITGEPASTTAENEDDVDEEKDDDEEDDQDESGDTGEGNVTDSEVAAVAIDAAALVSSPVQSREPEGSVIDTPPLHRSRKIGAPDSAVPQRGSLKPPIGCSRCVEPSGTCKSAQAQSVANQENARREPLTDNGRSRAGKKTKDKNLLLSLLKQTGMVTGRVGR